MKIKYISLLSLGILCGCMSKEKEYDLMLKGLLSGSIPYIQAEELDNLDAPYVLLDTRSPDEFSVSRIQGAELIPYENFDPEMVSGLPKDTTVILYCSVGYRSEKIGEKLKDLGFTDVRNLYGGIFSWKNSGYSVVSDEGTTTDSVHAYNKAWSRWLWNGTKVYD
jgi:rhodanese-related sulfurtransferase